MGSDMKVYISADMEGICGISSLQHISSTGTEYALARLWMTEDVNAAVEGAVQGGAKEVVVRDAHGRAINILPDKLHPAARLMAGWTPVLDMLQGCDEGCGIAFFIGYHPGPASPGGILSHTYSMEAIRNVTIGGITAGETLINAIQAGTHGVAVGLVTGEKALGEEIAPVLNQTAFVQTKVGFGYQSALLEPMGDCRERIRQAASGVVRRCLENGPGYPVYTPPIPIEARIDFHKAEAVLASRLVPGVETLDARSIALTAGSAREFIERFQLLTQVFYGMRSGM